MKYIGSFLLMWLWLTPALKAQTVEVIKFPVLENIISEPAGQKVKVINFWATWCRPCIKEIPHFEALQKKYSTNELEVFLISFDDVENLESRVKPFVKKRGLESSVKLLDETDYNAFIDKVDPSWSGAIPATLIIAGDKRRFVEGELNEAELNSLIHELNQ